MPHWSSWARPAQGRQLRFRSFWRRQAGQQVNRGSDSLLALNVLDSTLNARAAMHLLWLRRMCTSVRPRFPCLRHLRHLRTWYVTLPTM